LLAFSLVLAIFCFWSFVGFAIVSTLLTRRNLLQSALLAPVTGMGAVVVLVTALNWVGPVRIVGPIATVLLLALSAWLFHRRHTPVPFRRLAPFAAVLLLAALATGYPMLRFGFNWVSYSNDDMANYCLSAKLLLNHNQFSAPAAQDMLLDRDASLFYWYFDVLTPIRHGADEVLAWVLSLTGLSSHQGFMPTILTFQLVLIAASGALVLQSKKYRRPALLVCFWLALSALITLGTVYQLFGQVSGLAALVGATAVFLRTATGTPKSQLLLGGLLLASLGLFYPEVLPFLVLAYVVYQAISILQGCGRIRDVVGTMWPILVWWLLFANISVPVTALTLLDQVQAVAPRIGPSGLFPYYMTPAAFSYLWGFRAISDTPRGIFLDVAIVAGALLFVLAMAGTARQAWKRKPVAVVCLVMLALSLVLFRTGSEFGLFKIAMYLQPFLLGVTVLTWFDLRARSAGSAFSRSLLVGALALVIGFGTRAQVVYTVRSMGLGGSGLIEIPYASSEGLISQLKDLAPSQGITISDTFNPVLAKFESAYRGRLYFPVQDVIGPFLGNSLNPKFRTWNPMYWIYSSDVLKLAKARDELQFGAAFDMHGALPDADPFTVRRAVSGNQDFALIEAGPGTSVLNRRGRSSTHAGLIRVTSTQAEQNHLAFVASKFGTSYYRGGAARSSGTISMFQPEADFFYHGAMMESLGRTSLFRILNPTPRSRLVLEYTASLSQDHQNRIPAASAIGETREMLPVVGRGSARLISPPLQPQQIGGGDYVALDMGSWGNTFPDHRSFIMSLWGRQYVADNRRIVGFCRDISLISEDQYLAMQAPHAIQSFPEDLKNKNLEYSGIYEDGWVAELSEMVLRQDDGDSHLVVSVLVPAFPGRRVASWAALLVDGREVERKQVDSSAVGFDVLVPGQGRRRIALRFDQAVSLPSPDSRPVSAQLRYVGFQP
jgi:hypothetical protein